MLSETNCQQTVDKTNHGLGHIMLEKEVPLPSSAKRKGQQENKRGREQISFSFFKLEFSEGREGGSAWGLERE